MTCEFVNVTFQDVVATSAYVPYGTYVRDYRPPPSNRSPEYTVVRVGGGGYNCGLPDPLYSSVAPPPPLQNSMLNVSDPRLSATYGNPHLRQVWYCEKSFLVPGNSKFVVASDWAWNNAVLHLPPPAAFNVAADSVLVEQQFFEAPNAHLRHVDEGHISDSPAASSAREHQHRQQFGRGFGREFKIVLSGKKGGLLKSQEESADCFKLGGGKVEKGD